MFMMKASNRWVGVLGAAVMLSAAGVVASSLTDNTYYEGCDMDLYANGDCNMKNNDPECGYDGGDCCECTCEDGDYVCGSSGGFACIDPDASCVEDDDITSGMLGGECFVSGIADGSCNFENNKEECAYDGGDCCSCTCVSVGSEDYYGDCTQFACIDPEAECVDDDDITADFAQSCGYFFGFQDGYCDPSNNNPGCEYDGGDCCSCTCDPKNSIYYTESNIENVIACTEESFDCKDMEASCFGEEFFPDDDGESMSMSFESMSYDEFDWGVSW